MARLASAPLPLDPVFILGPWRSGTTALHERLAAAGHWVTPRTWQCFNPSTCFSSGPPSHERAAARPMDAGRISTTSPQEDEIALLLLGEPSVYRGFIDPRRLRECGEQLWSGSKGPLERWQDFLRGLASESPGARLLLKSPSHTFRLPLLRALFPRARYLWIGRHTGEVLASNGRMWRAMLDRYAWWSCPAGELEGFLEDMVRASTAVLGRCLQDLSPSELLWVDFEQLHASPDEVIDRVLRFLGMRPAEGASVGAASVPVHAGSRAPLPNDPWVHELESAMTAARQRFGGAGT